MRLEGVVKTIIEQVGLIELAGLLALLTLVLAAGFVVFRLPFLYGVILVVGLATGFAYGLGFIGMVGRYVLVALLAVVALVDRRPIHISRGTWVFLFCLLLYMLSFTRAASMADAMVRVLFYTCAFFGYLVLTNKLCQNPDQFRKAVYWMVGVSVLLAWIQVPFVWKAGSGRVGGLFEGVWYFQPALMLVIVLILYALIAGYLKRFWLIVGAVTLVIAVGMLVLTAGRTAVLSVIFTLPFLLKMRPGRGLALFVVIGIFSLLILPPVLLGLEGYDWAMEHLTSTDSSGRIEKWEAMWPGILESPVIGHGQDQDLLAFRGQGHNAFLQIAYACGIPTAAFILLSLTVALIVSWRQMGKLPVGPQRHMAGLSGALLMSVYFPSFLSMGLLTLDLPVATLYISLGMQSAVSQYIIAGRQAPQNVFYCTRPAGIGFAYGERLANREGV
jgi:O-antigen ligase